MFHLQRRRIHKRSGHDEDKRFINCTNERESCVSAVTG